MAALATTPLSAAGTTLTLAAAAGGGDTAIPGPTSFFVVNNASGGSITVTFDAQPATTDFGTAYPDNAVVVAAGALRAIPIPAGRYARASDGLVGVTYSGVTSLTVGVFSV